MYKIGVQDSNIISIIILREIFFGDVRKWEGKVVERDKWGVRIKQYERGFIFQRPCLR